MATENYRDIMLLKVSVGIRSFVLFAELLSSITDKTSHIFLSTVCVHLFLHLVDAQIDLS